MTSFEETPIHFSVDATSQSISDSESDLEIPVFTLPLSKIYADILQDAGMITNRSEDGTHSKNLFSELKYSQLPQQKKSSLVETGKKKIAAEPKISEQVATFQSKRQEKKIRMIEKEKTKGFGWYNMPAPEVTEEVKNDMTVVQMRQALDSKHFYKRGARKAMQNPKYFEVGTYVESPVDFYSSRIPKKQRKMSLVDELVSDMEFCSRFKRLKNC